jgi:hypothetical protein
MSIHPIMKCALLAGGMPPKLVRDIDTISPHDQPVVPADDKYGTTQAGVQRENNGLVAILSRENARLRGQVDELQNIIRAMDDKVANRQVQPEIPYRTDDIVRKFSLDGMEAHVSVTPEGQPYMTLCQIESLHRKVVGAADNEARDAIVERAREDRAYVTRKLKQDE